MNTTKLFHEYMQEVKNRSFRPGTWDCASFAGGWILKYQGVDHLVGLRGEYGSLEAGQTLIESKGFESHIDYLASIFEPIPRSQAILGDLAVVDGTGLGIVVSERVYVLNPGGMATVDLMRVTQAFKVGRD